jgi:hypothetical protein
MMRPAWATSAPRRSANRIGRGAAAAPGLQPTSVACLRDREHPFVGVVAGNTRAQRFWAQHGLQSARQRESIDTGGRLNTVHALVKPVTAGADLAAYLALMPRDRPGSTLP